MRIYLEFDLNGNFTYGLSLPSAVVLIAAFISNVSGFVNHFGT